MNKDIENTGFVVERTLHLFIVVFTAVLIISGAWFAYKGMQPQNLDAIEMPVSAEAKGIAKPLPDFIVDKIKSNELEQLKP